MVSDPIYLVDVARSYLGCRQNGPGSVFNIGHSSGGFIDMVMESFAGPHDFANAPWWYGPSDNLKEIGGLQAAFLDATTNYTTSLLFAAPFALAAIREQTFYYSSYAFGKR